MKKLTIAVAAAFTVLALYANASPVYAASGKACFDSCRTRLQRAGEWNKYPRGYCRQECNYYEGAPTDVLGRAGRTSGNGSAQACLQKCRSTMRANPEFQQNPANRRYCKDKCGVP